MNSKVMMMSTLWFFISLFVTVLSVAVAGEPQVPCFFVFGDSLVDNGNNNYRNTTAKVNFLPYGIDFPQGPTGRFSNGRNFADIIAELMGFEKYIPPFANATIQDSLRGVNYGSGGGGILPQTGRGQGAVISLSEQLSNHEVVISRLAKLLGGKKQAKQHLSKCIFSVVIGSNDYLNNYLPQFYDSSSTTPYTPQQFATALISQYSKHLRKLYRLGARKITVFPIGRLGCVPQQLSTYGTTEGSSCMDTSNGIAQIFDEKLKLLVVRLNNLLRDAKILYTESAATTFGTIINASDPCCEVASDGECEEGGAVCSNRDEYYFWDNFHPTEAATLLSATVAYTNMSPLYNDRRPIADS